MNRVLVTVHNCNVWKEYAKHYHESSKNYCFTIIFDDRVENLQNVENIVKQFGSDKWEILPYSCVKEIYKEAHNDVDGIITDYPYSTKLLGVWYMMKVGFTKLLHIEQDCLIVGDLDRVFQNSYNMYISNMTKIHESDYLSLSPKVKMLVNDILTAFQGNVDEDYYDEYISNLPIGAPIYLVYDLLKYKENEFGEALKKLNKSQAMIKLKPVTKPHIFNSDERILANLLVGNKSKSFVKAVFGRLTNKDYSYIKNCTIVHLVGPNRLDVLKNIYGE